MKADPSSRRKVILIFIIALIFGILFLKGFMPLFIEYLYTLPTKKAARIVISLLALLSVIPLTIGYLLLNQGLKIIRAERFPAPGTKVWKDTPIIKGKKARRNGMVLIVASIIILVGGVFNATVLPYGFYEMFEEKANEIAKSNNTMEWNADQR